MILSASRRTDIPALYGEWLVNRLAAGEVLIPQPYRAHHATRLLFSPETVDVLVLWSKNPAPFFTALDRVENLGYKNLVFQYTITAFDDSWEPHLPPLKQVLCGGERYTAQKCQFCKGGDAKKQAL